MALVPADQGLVDFERKAATEEADIEEIRRGILAIQAQIAASAARPLARGTHAKGVALRAELEVLDLTRTSGDPALAARLARGIFARPGTYPAVVRFANANGSHAPDGSPDVRALSFSIEVLPEATSAGVTRLDYSMNSATTFPINDAHAFAAIVRFKTAAGLRGRLRALRSLSLGDLRALVRTIRLGKAQTRGTPRLPYQQLRYWSTVPFLHGTDEAVKYTAIPDPGNPVRALESGPNCLVDELVRHVNEDARMSTFDIGLQLLDASRMTHRGRPQVPSFWIENAAVEWSERESPFHVVARLRLQPKSILPPAETEAFALDVTEHSTPESRPLGSINRARWGAEKASREARLAQPAAATSWTPPPNPARRIARSALGAALLVLVGVLGWALGAVSLLPAADDPASADVIYLDQGWTDDERRDFYHRSQGSQLLPYSWFTALPQPRRSGGTPDRLFRDSRYLATAFGFIPDEPDGRFNPDGLPIGFAKDTDPNGDEFIGLTCAACHTQQFTYQGKTIRIDGGPAKAEMNWFGRAMIQALEGAMLPTRFPSFAARALGAESSGLDRFGLAWSAGRSAARFRFLLFIADRKHLVPTEAGFGRLDALGKGGNTLFGEIITNPLKIRQTLGNLVPAGGHVAFPELWDAPYFDWAQYAGAIRQPMGRNTAEALGVYASVQFGNANDPFNSSVRVRNLEWMEYLLRKLKAPPWPEDVLGPIDAAKAERGLALYDTLCRSCHEFEQTDSAGGKVLTVKMRTFEQMGTDRLFATNFAERRVDTGQLGQGILSAPDVLTFLTTKVLERKYRELELTPEEIATLNCCGPNEFRAGYPFQGKMVAGVRGRPLNGAWASAPYLHNGSVPSMFELLGPVENRSKTFRVGSLEYDPVNLGFRTDGTWTFDTTVPGNSNRGHEFRNERGPGVVGRALSDTERYELIEYVKTIRDAVPQ